MLVLQIELRQEMGVAELRRGFVVREEERWAREKEAVMETRAAGGEGETGEHGDQQQ